jgi:carbamoyl-phosphate synthase/aspartate carbamoyltransferase
LSFEKIEEHIDNIPVYFESSRIHIAALIVGFYAEDYSHYLASSSLATWLKENNVPALFGVDTRALTKKIRNQGSLLAKVVFPQQGKQY